MYLCSKKNCVWRQFTGTDVGYCFFKSCPDSVYVPEPEKPKTIKWSGLITHPERFVSKGYYQAKKEAVL